MSETDFEEMMEKKVPILVFMQGNGCITCSEDRWSMFKTAYHFMGVPDFTIFEAKAGDVPEFDKEFKVKSDINTPQYYLFLNGNRIPFKSYDTEKLVDWITEKTQLDHAADFVVELTKDTYYNYFKKNPHRNALIMFYAPTYEHTHYVVTSFFRAAYAFRHEYKAVFIRVDCSKSLHLCEDEEIENVLGFKFIPAKGNEYDGEKLMSLRGEKIADFMNRHIATDVSPSGGLDESFGRITDLDVLAHKYLETKSAEKRKEIIKDVAKLRKRFKASAKYYRIMKIIENEGMDGFRAEKKDIRDRMKALSQMEGKEYESLRARENIIEQFKNIHTKKTLVMLTPWSFDYIVNGENNVMLLVTSKNCRICGILDMIYKNAAKQGLDGVIFAKMDADKYPDFASIYNTDPNVPAVWFQKGVSVNKSIPAKVETNVKSIMDFAREHMTAVQEETKEIEDVNDEVDDEEL